MIKAFNILKKKIYFDQYLFISITILSIMGLLFLYSASQENIETIIKQSFFVIFGLILMFFLSQFDPDFYKNDSDAFITMTEKLEVAKGDLEYYETRWLELESEKE